MLGFARAWVLSPLWVAGTQSLHLTTPHQTSFYTDNVHSWNDPVSEDATSHLIFHTLASSMQMAPNSQYNVGHSVMRATIPVGTVMYHGRSDTIPPRREWIAFDPEHSIHFARGSEGALFTYISTRELNVVYYDGSSANKLDGVADTQDILMLGKIQAEQTFAMDHRRLDEGCDVLTKYGIDGIVRMESDFELMYCDFNDGLEVLSVLPTLPRGRRGPAPPIPNGWKGSMDFEEDDVAGTWHNNLPGDSRVVTDPSTLITFFDQTFTSLISERRDRARKEWRLTNISDTDIAHARGTFFSMLVRPRSVRSGVDWAGLVHVIVERFSDRLPFLSYLLHNSTGYANATAHAASVRQHVGVALLPYMSRNGIDEFDTWLADIAHDCASTFTAHLPVGLMTEQELVLHSAVEEVLHEICRVYTSVWGEAFDVESQEPDVASERLERWTVQVDDLIDWLDWPIWTAVCNPPCAVDEVCYVSQHGPFTGGRDDPLTGPICKKM